tara:strand:+ start:540 stop:1499 length:960 start_codon:yes stop_codon:yes gene_type:complete
MKKKILLVSGDPNSINSELIFKSWRKINNITKKKIYLISNYNMIYAQFKKLKYPIKLTKVKNINENLSTNHLKIINIDIYFKDPFNISKTERSKFVVKCLNYAHQLAKKKEISGIINCAIDKSLLGKKKIGVTEFLASKCKVKNNKEVMLIKSKNFSVIPITTHVDIRQIVRKLSINKIVNKVKTAENWFKNYLYKKPKIGILGLNPHNAELRSDSEEKKIIIPAIKRLVRAKVNIRGPLVSDTVFINEYKKFDIIVGMYHDQVLTPLKTLYKFDAINITLGLKYLRLSPDHGTAKKMIYKKKANAKSLLECIYFLNKF